MRRSPSPSLNSSYGDSETLRIYDNLPYVTTWVQKQFKLGGREEAIHNVEKAFELAPAHELATKLKAEWNGLNDLRL